VSTITNNYNLPDPVFRALTEDNYSRGASNRSVTQLIDAPRQQILTAENDDQITYDASEMIWIILGKSVHEIFERYAIGRNIAETRMFAEVNGWTISGASDLQIVEEDGGITIVDYKCTSVWSVIYDKAEWHQQQNLYGWLVDQNFDLPVKRLRICAILRDWKNSEMLKNNSYPKVPLMLIDIPLWSKQKRHDYMHERVQVHQDAEFERLTGGDLPLCTPAERWERPTTYAVMKNKNKRALKVEESEEAAEQHIVDWYAKNIGTKDKLKVVVRPGDPVRCSGGWCRVAHLCDQYQGELKNENGS
jgi:hypothetical protein